MSEGRYSLRGYAFQGFAFRTWGLAGAGVTVTDPSCEGWIARPAVRQFVSPVASRLSITRPQDRVWIARVDNG